MRRTSGNISLPNWTGDGGDAMAGMHVGRSLIYEHWRECGGVTGNISVFTNVKAGEVFLFGFSIKPELARRCGGEVSVCGTGTGCIMHD